MSTYVTVAIPYVNAEPHLGYAYELVQADIYARARRLAGDDVRFLGGTDDHALKNVVAAAAAGLPTKDFVDANARCFAELAGPLDVSFDDYLRTSADPRHRPAVERLWRACAANGDLYERTYDGEYCSGCEHFWDPGELLDDGQTRRCPEHFTAVEHVSERNWFFRLSRYRDHVRDLLAGDRLAVHPRQFRDEVLAFVDRGLDDVSVSRPSSRADGWGIPVPGDPSQVVYVWFDALANYVSALGFGDPDSVDYRRWWLDAERRVHVIGKGILRFHAVYWPAFLASAGQPAPTRIEVHPYLTVEGSKISKSGTTAVSPFAAVERHGADAVRWWFARDVSPVNDTDFTARRLVTRVDDDLANGVGNVAARVAALARRAGVTADSGATPIDGVAGLGEDVLAALASFELRGATQAIVGAVDALNRDLDTVRPWEQLTGGASPHAGLARLLRRYLASVAEIAAALRPIVPALAARVDASVGGDPVIVQPRLAAGGLGHAPRLPRPTGDLDAVAHAELALDVGDVALDGAEGDEQLLADLGVGPPAGE
jgi:methionyl-tRNA synthetase